MAGSKKKPTPTTKSPKPADIQLQHDHREQRFSILGLEARNLHLGALYSLIALRAGTVIILSLFVFYFLALEHQFAYTLAFGSLAAVFAYLYYRNHDGPQWSDQVLATLAGVFGILAITSGLELDIFAVMISGIATIVIAGLMYSFINHHRFKDRLPFYPNPSGVIVMIALCALFMIWPLALLQLALGLSALLMLFIALAVLRYCIDTGHETINMRQAYSSLRQWLRSRKISRDDRVALHDSLFFEGKGTRIEIDRFVIFMALSGVIATVAIISESPAVIIGAMLIAPLMTPLMSTTIALFMGWPKRLNQALSITLAGIGVAIVVSMLTSLMVPGDVIIEANSELLPRISPTLLDLWVALAAGCAGAVALSRQDRFTSISGAAVAIALVPPLAATGITLQQAEWAAAYGAFLLFLTNAVAIVLISGLVFVLGGVVPIAMLGRSQSRVGVAIVTLQVAALLVFAGLMINGQTATISLLHRDRTRATVSEWLESHPSIVLDGFRLEDNVIELQLSGPGDPPQLDDLGLLLRREKLTTDDSTINLRWTPTIRQQYRLIDL